MFLDKVLFSFNSLLSVKIGLGLSNEVEIVAVELWLLILLRPILLFNVVFNLGAFNLVWYLD